MHVLCISTQFVFFIRKNKKRVYVLITIAQYHFSNVNNICVRLCRVVSESFNMLSIVQSELFNIGSVEVLFSD